MHLSGGRPIASFDPEGLIFAAGIESKQLKLYDLRSFDKVGIIKTTHMTTPCFFARFITLHSVSLSLSLSCLYLLGTLFYISCLS